jgi:sugar phosphate permease
MVISTVPLFHAMSVWAIALEREFGWNRTQLGFALTFTRVEGGLMGPLEGYLTDKVGTRRMVFVGLTILGGAFIFFGFVQNLWMFYLAYVLMAVGQGLGS